MEEIKILEGAEEFTLGDGPTGVVLVHGFTSSPQNMRLLGDHLAERGIAVVAPRLPGHGTTWQDLNTRTASEWIQTVEDAFLKAAAERDEVFLVGLSFGAALALELAARYPDRVAGVVTLAGLVQTRDPRRFFARVIKRVAKSLPGVGNDIADPEGREIVYDRLPTGAAHQMLKTIKRARLALPAVRCPVLIMHGRGDHTVPPWNATVIHDTVSSDDKELVWLERSYHVVTLDHDRDEVFERTYDFIKKRAKKATNAV
ncbi:MAG: alpha/beta hydrolase [Actinomycetota bacterium]